MASSPPPELARELETSTYVLYNKTYTLHRLSPLHNLPSLSCATLASHAHRLLSILRGDVLRGVHVGLDSNADGVVNAGRLDTCEWKLLANGEAWERGQDADEQGGPTAEKAAGVCIELRYEKITYMAHLLRNPNHAKRRAREGQQEDESPGVGEEGMHLPLLLMHMPSPLRSAVQDYLATTFDTCIEEMRLSYSFLAAALEGFLADVSSAGAGRVAKVIKDLQITLTFRGPVAPSLRTLDITIRREDVQGFLIRGKSMATGKDVEDTKPFMSALGAYLKAQMALDMGHEDVGVAKLACGGFVLAREGKIKIVAPAGGAGVEEDEDQMGRRAVVGLMGRLFERAEVRGFEDELGG